MIRVCNHLWLASELLLPSACEFIAWLLCSRQLPCRRSRLRLRVLQEGEFHRVGGEQPVHVSVRVIAATNRDLLRLAAQQQFREDLYYRLSVMPIRVPPLRERAGDVPLLALHFLDEFCRRNNFRPKSVDPAVMAALESYAWPGNVRELRNTMERMAILTTGDAIEWNAVPSEVRTPTASPRQAVVQEAERALIVSALRQSEGNVSSAARALGMERTNLHKRMRSLGIQRP
ncbi:MAG: sigma-54-dependent Fis family transcriptional regulator [Acidobacteriia bacterium]|nr:sigma-54-dependent Fis family transcriptional regulator [Terriglobia bacterium]